MHRDIKPQNCIVSSTDSKIKLIDLGAAADLRVGINYAPKEYLLDPRVGKGRVNPTLSFSHLGGKVSKIVRYNNVIDLW